MTDPEALLEDEWPCRVLAAIENDTLTVAGHELAQIVNFALKTQHDEQFNRDVRNCVLAFWNRCEREKAMLPEVS